MNSNGVTLHEILEILRNFSTRNLLFFPQILYLNDFAVFSQREKGHFLCTIVSLMQEYQNFVDIVRLGLLKRWLHQWHRASQVSLNELSLNKTSKNK